MVPLSFQRPSAEAVLGDLMTLATKHLNNGDKFGYSRRPFVEQLDPEFTGDFLAVPVAAAVEERDASRIVPFAPASRGGG